MASYNVKCVGFAETRGTFARKRKKGEGGAKKKKKGLQDL